MQVQEKAAEASGKSWSERMRAAKPHQRTRAPIPIGGVRKGDWLFIPSPQLLDEFIRAIPEGESRNIAALRKTLARKFDADATCPITTGLQLRVVAEAAYEAHIDGAPIEAITPFWRVLDVAAPVTKKLACGAKFVAERREQEGVAALNNEDEDEARRARYDSKGLWA